MKYNKKTLKSLAGKCYCCKSKPISKYHHKYCDECWKIYNEEKVFPVKHNQYVKALNKREICLKQIKLFTKRLEKHNEIIERYKREVLQNGS